MTSNAKQQMQYRRLGRELVDRPQLLRELGHHFTYYAGMARIYGMVFAPQLNMYYHCHQARA